MKESKLIIYIKIVTNFLIFTCGALALFILLPKVLKFFLPFVIGWIVAMIANPLVRFLEKKVKIRRKHSSAIIILLAIAAIVGVAVLLFSILFREISELKTDLPVIVQQAQELMDSITRNVRKITATLPSGIQDSIEKIIKDIGSSVTEIVGKIKPFTVSNAGSFAKNVAEGFLMVIVTIISAYFFIATRDELVAKLRTRLPKSLISYLHLIYDNFKAAVGGYFKAQFKIMMVLTIIMFIGFEILKINYSFVFAIGIAFLDLLPVFGTGVILWPWALVNIITGNYVRAVSLIAIYIICQVVKQVLQPKMVGDSIGLNPLATLVFMYIGYQFAGVFGMIIGIPIGMVLVNMYKIGIFDRIIRGFKIIANDLNEFRKF